MIVTIIFGSSFYGRIYPKGYFKVDNCGVSGNGERSLMTYLPLDGCGTQSVQDRNGKTIYKNLLVVMNEATWGILEMGDRAYTVSCDMGTTGTKTVQYGVTVPMLSTTELPMGTVMRLPECRMKLVAGTNPEAAPANSLNIGQLATLAFYISDEDRFDLTIHHCFAHDGTPDGKRVKLVDAFGCSAMPKLVGHPQNRRDPQSRVSYMYYYMKIFKFPDVSNVYFECRCDVCLGSCGAYDCVKEIGWAGPAIQARRRRKREVDDANTIEKIELHHSVSVNIPENMNLSALTDEASRAPAEMCLHKTGAILGLLTMATVVMASMAVIVAVVLRFSKREAKLAAASHNPGYQ
ncbi:PREDICTED: cuticlin-1-like [Priapulus caudatus]|uniref:Cuticlin-1-like n=1 Tax=Priapulus caudatus TaxID=37621 RepID=A0ABM1EPA3_PRICU|nr:PREDICTED: cuticlin-1-like [Priapulus caudatus]